MSKAQKFCSALSKVVKNVKIFGEFFIIRQNPLFFALDRTLSIGYNVIACGNRLAVWRQLPKLILAGSIPVIEYIYAYILAKIA